MKLKLIFEVENETGDGFKNISKTFSKFVDGVTDDSLKAFANAYNSLLTSNSYESYKIVTQLIA